MWPSPLLYSAVPSERGELGEESEVEFGVPVCEDASQEASHEASSHEEVRMGGGALLSAPKTEMDWRPPPGKSALPPAEASAAAMRKLSLTFAAVASLLRSYELREEPEGREEEGGEVEVEEGCDDGASDETCDDVFPESELACAEAAKASAAAVAAVASSRRILRRRVTARSCALSMALAVTVAAVAHGMRGGGSACWKMQSATSLRRGRCGLSATVRAASQR